MKFVNMIGIGASDMVYMELSCFESNNKVYTDRYCMTFEKLKQLQDVIATTVHQCEEQLAERKLAN